MPFILVEQDEQDLMKEQAKLPERNLGLLLPVLIERRIGSLIQNNWRNDSKGDVFNFLFGKDNSGALSDPGLSAKIGFAIGLYDETMLHDIGRIIRIRNAFAHLPSANSFEGQPVCNFVNELRLLSVYPLRDPTQWTIAGKSQKQLNAEIMHWSGLVDLTPRRHKFIRAVEIILTWLTLKSGHQFEYRDSKISPIRPHPHTLVHGSS